MTAAKHDEGLAGCSVASLLSDFGNLLWEALRGCMYWMGIIYSDRFWQVCEMFEISESGL